MKFERSKQITSVIASALAQGTTPEKLAMSVALALCIAAIPMLGVTSLLCLVAALVFRLNLAVMQAVNWAATPLQLALIVPFYRAGEKLFALEPLRFSAAELISMIREHPVELLTAAWRYTVAGTCVWILISIPAAFLISIPLRLVFARVVRSRPGRQRDRTRVVAQPASSAT